MNDLLNIRIESLAYGGEAIGRLPDGRAVFIPFAIPGELVQVRLVEEKPRYARAELNSVLEPSPRRIEARCSHFATCGGCHYQQMDYSTQLEGKTTILRDQLERIGGLQELPSFEIIASPNSCWNYRNHVQFHLTPQGKLGFQKMHSNQTFAIRECHLPEASINRVWPQIEIEPMPGLERMILRTGVNDDMMLILESSNPQPLEFNIEAEALSVVYKGPGGSLVQAGSDHIVMEIMDRQFRVSAASFFQVNTIQAEAMVNHILSNLPMNEGMSLLDVYCGVGLFSAFLAEKVKLVVGIESSPEACTDFISNLDEYDHVSLYEDKAENVLESVNFNPDVILMDPPREGLGIKTVDGLLAQGAPQLVYVSCDPATLARDAKRLVNGGYSLEKIALVDMFPQTFHLESISYWELNG
jgi:23S rRNA (uracil1939-C5)-methyltransferase